MGVRKMNQQEMIEQLQKMNKNELNSIEKELRRLKIINNSMRFSKE